MMKTKYARKIYLIITIIILFLLKFTFAFEFQSSNYSVDATSAIVQGEFSSENITTINEMNYYGGVIQNENFSAVATTLKDEVIEEPIIVNNIKSGSSSFKKIISFFIPTKNESSPITQNISPIIDKKIEQNMIENITQPIIESPNDITGNVVNNKLEEPEKKLNNLSFIFLVLPLVAGIFVIGFVYKRNKKQIKPVIKIQQEDLTLKLSEYIKSLNLTAEQYPIIKTRLIQTGWKANVVENAFSILQIPTNIKTILEDKIIEKPVEKTNNQLSKIYVDYTKYNNLKQKLLQEGKDRIMTETAILMMKTYFSKTYIASNPEEYLRIHRINNVDVEILKNEFLKKGFDNLFIDEIVTELNKIRIIISNNN